MSRTLKMKQGDSGTELNLLAGSGSGWNVKSWFPQVANVLPDGTIKPVQEEMICSVEGSSHDDLATDLQAMHEMRRYAANYMGDITWDVPVWLHFKLDDESSAVRALVLNSRAYPFEMAYESEPSSQTGAVEQDKARIRLRFWRQGAWERTSKRDMPQNDATSGAAITFDYTQAGTGGSPSAHDIVGDVEARIENLRIQPWSSGAEIDRLWIGTRSAAKHHTIGNFEPIWECEDGANEAIASDDTTTETNTASPGSGSGAYVEGTPSADDTWEKYFEIEVQDVDANTEDQFGRYLMLLRAKLDQTDTFQIQLRFGYTGFADDEMVRGPKVEITNETAWDFYPMGHFTIPMVDLQAFEPWLAAGLGSHTQSIQVWAKREAGGDQGKIFFDCMIAVPIDEGYLFAEGIGASQYDVIRFVTTPLDRLGVEVYDSDHITKIPATETYRWGLPPGDGLMVLVYAGVDESVLTDTVLINSNDAGRYYERWLTLRGGE